MRLLLSLSLLFVLSACAQKPVSAPESPAEAVAPLPAEEYKGLIGKYTMGTDQYSGFYQTFQADVTILNTRVMTAVLRQRGAFLQWDTREYQREREKFLQEASAYSKFFLRFFSPEREYADLHKGKSIWKVYLEVGGSRFEGKVRKMDQKLVELQTLFPHVDRFSVAYEVTFNVPMTTVERSPSKVVLTSSLGAAEFKFPASE
ncbi:MAG: hypothetical protein AB7G93_19115 [Bdellovibrionales bacterium]